MKLSSFAILAIPALAAGASLTEPTTEILDATVSFQVDDATCDYKIAVKFKHSDTLPLPPGPEACNPADPQIAPDGLPYLAERTHYMLLSDEIREATPFDHLSLDFQACGHPPFNVFTKPHYDFHVYMDPVAERELRDCDPDPSGAPICSFPVENQTTDAGKAFYDPIPTNVVGFEVGGDTAVPFSGIHSWDFDTQPATSADWTEPVFVTGGYGNALVFWEPMIPIEMVTGPTNRTFEETLVFEGDDIPGLPLHYQVDYDSTTGYTTVTISEATARNCEVAAPTSAVSSLYPFSALPLAILLLFGSILF